MKIFFLSSFTLFKREVIRFFRQKNRIAGALGTPLVFWFLFGSGLGESFQNSLGLSYLQYFYPGTILLILLFTAIFSTISIIEDRREGFLQGVLVSPAPRSALVFGTLLGGTALALGQGLIFVLMSPFLGVTFQLVDFFYLISIIILIAFGLTGLGFILAWKSSSTQGFHAIMNLFLMPLWLLSGALFPVEGVPQWLKAVMTFNPLTYAISGLHMGFYGSSHSPIEILSSRFGCMAICLAFSSVMFFLSVKVASKKG